MSVRWLWLVCLMGCFDSTEDGEGSGRGLFSDGGVFSRPQISTSHERLEFGRVAVGTSKTFRVAVRNPGRVPLTITGVELAFGAPHYRLTVDGQAPAAVVGDPDGDGVPGLSPDRGFAVEVTLEGDVPTRALGSMVVTSDAPERPELEVVFTGTLAEPRCLEVPAEVVFAPQRVGQAETLEFELGSCNSSSVTVESVRLQGDGPFDVSAPIPPYRVPPRPTVAVRFAPQSPGQFESRVVVTSDDDAETERAVRVRGEGLVNACPVARLPEARQEGLQNEWINLTGAASRDPDGEGGRPLTYNWRAREAPDVVGFQEWAVADGEADDRATPRAAFLPRSAGLYIVELRVGDERPAVDLVDVCPDSVAVMLIQVRRNPQPELEVDLRWATPGLPDPRRDGNEVTLLLRHPRAQGWDDAPWVCELGEACDQDWGDPDGNPLARVFGGLGSSGPFRLLEVLRVRETDGRPYRVAARYRTRLDVDGFDYGPTHVVVQIRSEGRVVFDSSTALPASGTLVEAGTLWEVANFHWRPARIEAVDRVLRP